MDKLCDDNIHQIISKLNLVILFDYARTCKTMFRVSKLSLNKKLRETVVQKLLIDKETEHLDYFEKYFEQYNMYNEIYGDKFILVQQLGSFYEIYKAELKPFDIFHIANLLWTTVTKKFSKFATWKNPYVVSVIESSSHLQTLCNHGYIVMFVNGKNDKLVSTNIIIDF